MSASDQALPIPPRLSWLKRIVRFVLHLIILYEVVRLSTGFLPTLAYTGVRWHTGGMWERFGPLQLLFSYLMVFSLIPAFVAGLVINARLRHEAAAWVWIVPLVVLILWFLFMGPDIYPTMLWQSDFPKAFRYFFGRGLRIGADASGFGDFFRAYTQLRCTVPAYAGAAYSVGALLGMNDTSRRLQEFMQKV